MVEVVQWKLIHVIIIVILTICKDNINWIENGRLKIGII